MKNTESKNLYIQTTLTPPLLWEKLNRITTGEFHDAIKSSEYKYYGKVSENEFDIRNKKYGPYSNGPWIKGKISKEDKDIAVIIEIDIDEQIEIIKKMMYPYFIVLGMLIMTAGVFMGETRLITLAVGAFMVASPFLLVTIIKRLLKSMQQEEMKQFLSIVSA